jgi:phosphatidylglycerol:prolipoprotein diacylglycerol transferase
MLPILYQNHDFILYSYPLLMGLGWGVAYQIFFGLLPNEINVKNGQIIFWGLFLFSWLGSKLLFYLTLPTHLSQDLLTQMSFWTGGGFVFYGGLIASIFFLMLLKSIGIVKKIENLWPVIPALTFGHAIGRIGCLLAGCCYGSVTDWWWGIFLHGQFRHPTQILEAVSLFFVGILILKSQRPKYQILSIYFISYGLIRLTIEALRGDEIRGHWGPLTPSSWISSGLMILGFFLLMKSKKSVG